MKTNWSPDPMGCFSRCMPQRRPSPPPHRVKWIIPCYHWVFLGRVFSFPGVRLMRTDGIGMKVPIRCAQDSGHLRIIFSLYAFLLTREKVSDTRAGRHEARPDLAAICRRPDVGEGFTPSRKGRQSALPLRQDLSASSSRAAQGHGVMSNADLSMVA